MHLGREIGRDFVYKGCWRSGSISSNSSNGVTPISPTWPLLHVFLPTMGKGPDSPGNSWLLSPPYLLWLPGHSALALIPYGKLWQLQCGSSSSFCWLASKEFPYLLNSSGQACPCPCWNEILLKFSLTSHRWDPQGHGEKQGRHGF